MILFSTKPPFHLSSRQRFTAPHRPSSSFCLQVLLIILSSTWSSHGLVALPNYLVVLLLEITLKKFYSIALINLFKTTRLPQKIVLQNLGKLCLKLIQNFPEMDPKSFAHSLTLSLFYSLGSSAWKFLSYLGFLVLFQLLHPQILVIPLERKVNKNLCQTALYNFALFLKLNYKCTLHSKPKRCLTNPLWTVAVVVCTL